MKLKQLQALLEDVDPFATPKIALEQYATSAQVAAHILHAAHAHGDVDGCVLVDLGCGAGVLSIAAVLMGASHVVRTCVSQTAPRSCCFVRCRWAAPPHGAPAPCLTPHAPQLGVDVDADALRIAASNCAQFEDLHVDLLLCDVSALPARLQADTVVTCVSPGAHSLRALRPHAAPPRCCRNPPFGTRRKGADLDFLRAACAVARRAVYSLHKARTGAGFPTQRAQQRDAWRLTPPSHPDPHLSTCQTSTREHVQRFAQSTLGVGGKVRAAARSASLLPALAR